MKCLYRFGCGASLRPMIILRGSLASAHAIHVAYSLMLVLSLAPLVGAGEMRTYEFILDDSYNYNSDCGECSLVYGTRARVTGQFQVSLDLDSGIGVLESLDVTLVDVETLTGGVTGPAQWVPQPDRSLFESPGILDAYKPPLLGVLESAGSNLILSPSGTSVMPPDAYSPPQTFYLTMFSDEAEFDFFLPIIEFVPRITGARAQLVSVVPEPTALCLALFGLTSVLVAFRLRAVLAFRGFILKGSSIWHVENWATE